MNALFVATLACLAALAYAAPSGIGAVVTGPSGVVTNAGPIGPAGHGVGLGVGAGWGLGGVVAAAPAVAVAGPVVGVGLGHGLGAVTNGGGTIGVSGHGAAIRGPPTAPVVVSGPSGKVTADGLWGPTANIGLTGGHGGWGVGGWGAGGWGHGW